MRTLPYAPGDGLVEDIENNYPEDRFVLTANTFFGQRTNLLLRLRYFGKHWDERGRTGGVDGGPPTARIDASPIWISRSAFRLRTTSGSLAAG